MNPVLQSLLSRVEMTKVPRLMKLVGSLEGKTLSETPMDIVHELLAMVKVDPRGGAVTELLQSAVRTDGNQPVIKWFEQIAETGVLERLLSPESQQIYVRCDHCHLPFVVDLADLRG